MALDLSADALVRAGSGVLYLVAGLIALAIARRAGPARPLAIGVALVAFGLGAFLIPRNILSPDPRYFGFLTLEFVVSVCLQIVGAAFLVWRLAPASRPRIGVLALMIGVAVAIPVAFVAFTEAASVAEFVGLPLDAAQGVAVVFVLQSLASGLLGGAALAFALNPQPKARAALALVLVSLDAYFALTTGSSVAATRLLSPGFVAASLFVHAPIVAAGLIEMRRGHVLSGRILAWGVLALVVEESAAAALGIGAFTLGIVRSVAAAVLAYTILRANALGSDARPTFVRRGTLAAGTLATVFIVAQIAQNFFSAEYGLLTGGIVAGAFLFAASPIQRAMERMGERRAYVGDVLATRQSAEQNDSATRREEVYRKAVRVAMADHVVTRDEDVHLYELAEELGIGAGRAAQLRRDVEQEARG